MESWSHVPVERRKGWSEVLAEPTGAHYADSQGERVILHAVEKGYRTIGDLVVPHKEASFCKSISPLETAAGGA